MATPETFKLAASTQLFKRQATQYVVRAALALPHDILRWDDNGKTNVMYVSNRTYYVKAGHTTLHGFIKTWDKRGRKIRKGMRRTTVTLPDDMNLKCIGTYNF